MTVGGKKESFYILGSLLQLAQKIWRFEKNPFKIWQIWGIFLHEKSLI
jgi:hypothetical protein